MIEQNIIEWLELGDSVQKLDLYNKKATFIYVMNYLLSQFGHFSEIFYFLIILLFFAQIIELNIAKIDEKGDGILKIIKYLEKLFLYNKIINNNTKYIVLLLLSMILYFLSTIFSMISMILYNTKKKKNRFLLTTNSILNLLLIYYINGPSINILLYKFFCTKDNKTYLCPFKDFGYIFLSIINIIYLMILIIGIYISTLYVDDIGCITGTNIRCKINNNYTTIIVMVKAIYFLFNFFIETFYHKRDIIILIYDTFIMLSNIIISIYTYRELFYYNNYINAWYHYGWKYTTWFSICIFMKNLIKIKDITLFVLFGLIIITIAVYYNNKHRYFELITEFNIFEGSNLSSIQVFNHKLLDLLKNTDQKSKILISGVIKRFEEYISNNAELYEQYHKLLNDKHLQKKFTSENELTILSIIYLIYSFNIEKSKDVTDITLNMCYFLINRFKNPVYSIWLCTKLKSCNNSQSYYKYVLIEEIKDYLVRKMKKNVQKLNIRNIQISSSILYNQYVNLFKIKIYEATCSHIEFYDLLRNKIATTKTIDNYLHIGEDVLTLRKEVLNLWDKIILLNPFSVESKNDFLLYVGSVLQDYILVKQEEKKFYALQSEKMPEKDNIYYSMFNQELSAVLLADGYTFNGKIVYTTPNFPFLFMFSEKEIINISVDDLLPDIIQSFHKFLIEDTIKNSNLDYIFKEQKDSLLKGKNGILFNVNIFIKPVPNLCYGLIYFIYLKKNIENNFIMILDENLIINGFTEINQIGSNFIWGNNYNLTSTINGHHIGLIIPEILLYLNYELKTNTFSLPKYSVDLKGYLYPINNFDELDEKIQIVLAEIKARKFMENNNENKIGSFDEYDDLIKYLNNENSHPFSIFFKFELHNFIDGKYSYYRLYITTDFLIENENILNSQLNSDILIKNRNKNNKEYLKKTIMSTKLKELNEDFNSELNNEIEDQNNNNINNNNNNDNQKLIKLRNAIKEQNKNNDKLNNKSNLTLLKLEKSKDFHSNQNSALVQSKVEPVVFNKIKKYILKKIDCCHVKRIRYLSYYFIFVNIILISFDFFYEKDLIEKMIEFYRENKYFINAKICCTCIYTSAVNLRFINKGYINSENFQSENYTLFYIQIIKNSLTEIKLQKKNIFFFHRYFQKIFSEKIKIHLFYDNTTNYNELNLDMNNFLNLILSQGLKIISILNDHNNNINDINENDNLEVYLRNILSNILNFFFSEYKEFHEKEKTEKVVMVAFHYPICFLIYLIFLIFVIYIYYSYIILIKDIHIFYFDKLMNFASPNFEIYLKKLDEIKKKLRDDSNEDEEKNVEEVEMREEMDEKNEYNSKIKSEEKIKKEENLNNKAALKKKKQNKIQQQKIKNKRIISDYLLKFSIFLNIKFGIIFLLSTSYYIVEIIVNIKMRKNYNLFDRTIETINSVFFEHFKIFLNFKKELDIFDRTGYKSEFIDNEIIRPNFGKSLINIIKSSKYSKKNLDVFEKLYSENGCEILSKDNKQEQICRNLLSSILNKGFEQAIVQLNAIITNIVNDINSLKNISELYKINSIFSGYEIFMEEYMFKAFITTQDIFNSLRNDEKKVIINFNKTILLIFAFIYIILFILCLYYIYSYKDFTGGFLCFIGIIPPEYMSDDNEFYKQIIGLEPFYS